MSQLLELADSWRGHDVFSVTTTEVLRGRLEEYGNVYVVGECNHKYPLKVLRVLFRCVAVVCRERPDVVLSTGAAAGCLMCFISKMRGAKIIWVDSVTNVRNMSISGRMIRCVADLYLVQWPELAEKYKNVEYAGAVI